MAARATPQLAFPFARAAAGELAQEGAWEEPGALPAEDAVEALHRRLGRALGEPIDLVTTTNRRTVASWRRGADGLLRVRCLAVFAEGDEDVVRALACVISGREPEAMAAVRAFAAERRAGTSERRQPRYAPPLGRHHDLREVFARENAAHFEGAFHARVGWSLVSKGMSRRQIRLGSWQPAHRLIKVHPVLDGARVPRYVLQFVVFHEMLHGALGGTQAGQRNVFHTPEFRRREAAHPDHARATAWIRANLARLLDY